MATTRKKSQIDQIIESLNEGQRKEFDDFCKGSRSPVAIVRLLAEWGHTVSQATAQQWYRVKYPAGESARALNSIVKKYQGIEEFDCLQFGLGLIVEQLSVVQTELSKYQEIKKKQDAEEPLTTAEQLYLKGQWLGFVSLLPNLTKELRSIASGLNDYKYFRDRKELELSGGEAVVQELLLIFKDSSMETAVAEACRGAMAKLEGR